jgi:hypothetical protein
MVGDRGDTRSGGQRQRMGIARAIIRAGQYSVAAHSRAIAGSINLTPGSFESRRELAIQVYASNVVHRLVRIAHHD